MGLYDAALDHVTVDWRVSETVLRFYRTAGQFGREAGKTGISDSKHAERVYAGKSAKIIADFQLPIKSLPISDCQLPIAVICTDKSTANQSTKNKVQRTKYKELLTTDH